MVNVTSSEQTNSSCGALYSWMSSISSKLSSIDFMPFAASLGSMDTIGLGGTDIDSLRCIRVLKAPADGFPNSILSTILTSKDWQFSRAWWRFFGGIPIPATISRNCLRNVKRVSIASRAFDGDFSSSALTMDNAWSSSSRNLGVSISSSIDNEAVLIEASSSWYKYRSNLIDIRRKYCPFSIRLGSNYNSSLLRERNCAVWPARDYLRILVCQSWTVYRM